jgi:hypothetical protein
VVVKESKKVCKVGSWHGFRADGGEMRCVARKTEKERKDKIGAGGMREDE